MLKVFAASIAIVWLATSAAAQTAAPSAAVQSADPSPAHEQFVEIGIGQLSSPFTTATVLKLNAIVARSKAVIDRFDASIPAIRKSVAAGSAADATPDVKSRAKASLAELDALSASASADLADMKAAERQVRSSGEKYNDTILSAMVRFVADVDDELRTECHELSAGKAASPPDPQVPAKHDR